MINETEYMKMTKKDLVGMIDKYINMNKQQDALVIKLTQEVGIYKPFKEKYENESAAHRKAIDNANSNADMSWNQLREARGMVRELEAKIVELESKKDKDDTRDHGDNTINGDIIGHKVECRNCLYWSEGTNDRGRCHHECPRISNEDSYVGVFPVTLSKDWCGDFNSKFQCTEDTGMYVDANGNRVIDVIDIAE